MRVVITALGVDVYELDALAESWLHGDDAALTAGLTEVFGFEPTVTRTTGPCEGGPCFTDTIDWEGFQLEIPEHRNGMRVTALVSAVRDVSVSAAEGSAVGDDAQALAAAHPDSTNIYPSPTGEWMAIEVDVSPDPLYADSGVTVSVRLVSQAPFTELTSIVAPIPNEGI